MNHKEMTAHIRNRIKKAGIKARVRMQEYCGYTVIQVNAPEYGVEFSSESQREICLIAQCNGLTFAQGMEINVNQDTNPFEFNFYMP